MGTALSALVYSSFLIFLLYFLLPYVYRYIYQTRMYITAEEICDTSCTEVIAECTRIAHLPPSPNRPPKSMPTQEHERKRLTRRDGG